MMRPALPALAAVAFAALARAAEPNLILDAGRDFADVLVARPVDRSQGVDQTRDRLTVRGTSTVRGRVALHFEPCEEFAALRLVFDGQVLTHTLAERGPVQLANDGTIRFTLRKCVALDGNAFRWGPAEVHA